MTGKGIGHSAGKYLHGRYRSFPEPELLSDGDWYVTPLVRRYRAPARRCLSVICHLQKRHKITAEIQLRKIQIQDTMGFLRAPGTSLVLKQRFNTSLRGRRSPASDNRRVPDGGVMAPSKKVVKKAARAKKSAKLTRTALAKVMMPHADIIKLMSTGTPDPKPPVLGHAKAPAAG